MARTRRAAAAQHRDAWWTPDWLRAELLAEWNVTLDACACPRSALVEQWIGPEHPGDLRNALDPDLRWSDLAGPGGVVYCCPPFTPPATLSAFLARCVETARGGTTVVSLIPAAVTTVWWKTYVSDPGARVRPIVGRVKFDGPHATGGAPRWGVALVEWPAQQ
ncbi:DNA N-6-adenine-methyltransferase [Blastococcus sp. SYSU DS0753]